MNLKNAKEMKKSVSEIIKNHTKCTKKLKNASKTSKVSVKNGKKMTKKQQEQMKKLNKFLLKFILIEYAVCAGVLLVANNIELIRQNKSQDEMIIKQQNIIFNLTQTNINLSNLNENSGDIQVIATENKIEKKALKITDSDRELIAKLLYHEARGESLECQKAVVSVIINRLNSGKWGKTIKDVIYAKNQFEPVSRGLVERTKPLENQYKAIDYVLENGVTVPAWVQYFRADYHFNWMGYSQYCQLSHTYFGGFNG